MVPPKPLNEAERLAALRGYDVLDTSPEEGFDRITRIASELLQTPIALVSLVDEHRQWFKSRVGLDASETSRDVAFCSHAILGDDILVVPDALSDDRFSDNPLVVDGPRIRFYAGAPLRTSNGHNLGTLCVIDTKPREITRSEKAVLRDLAAVVIDQLNLRSVNHRAREELEVQQRLKAESAMLSERMEKLLNSTPTGIAEVDLSGCITYANLRWCQIVGYTVADAVGQQWLNTVHPDERPEIAKVLQPLLHGEEVDREFRHVGPDGGAVWVHGTAIPLRDEHGEVSGFLGTIQDISARIRAEDALDASRSLLQAIVEAVPHPISYIDRDCRLKLVNPAWCALFRSAPESVLGRTILEWDPIPMPVRKALYQDNLDTFRSGVVPPPREYTLKAGDGSDLILVVSKTAVRDAEDRMTGIVTVGVDVTSLKRAEEDARHARRRLVDALESMPAGMQIFDAAGRLEFANSVMSEHAPELADLWSQPGTPLREILERSLTILDASPEERAGRLERRLAEYDNPPHSFEYRLKSGRHFIGYDRRTHEGGYISVRIDITDRKRAEQELLNSNRLLNAVTRAQRRFITEQSVTEVFESLLSDLLALSGSQLGFVGEAIQHPDGAPSLKTHAIAHIAEDGEAGRGDDAPAQLGAMFDDLPSLFAAVLQDARPMIVNNPSEEARAGGVPSGRLPLNAFLGIPVFQRDTLVGVIGLANRESGYDEALLAYLEPVVATCGNLIAARRAEELRTEIEAALADQTERLKNILTNMAEGLLVIDKHGMLVETNDAFCALMDWKRIPPHTPDSLYRALDLRHMDGKPYTRKSAGIARALREGDAIIDEQVTVQRGESRWDLLMSSAPIRGRDGGQTGVVAVLHDVTELKKVERMKAEFVSSVSHELRTPLTSVVGYVNLILDGDAGEINDTQREFLKIIEVETDRLAAIISDILDIQKLESGRMMLLPADFDMREVLQHTYDTFALTAKDKGLQLVLDCPATLPMHGDRNRLAQVFANLVSNSIKYTLTGEVRIAASMAASDIIVDVIDTGIGIPKEAHKSLFTRFFRVDHPHVRATSGTGLGLVVSESIVTLHGGRIEIESVLDQGSTFRVVLPAQVAEGGPEASTDAQPAQPTT